MHSIRKTMPTEMNGTAWFFYYLELKEKSGRTCGRPMGMERESDFCL